MSLHKWLLLKTTLYKVYTCVVYITLQYIYNITIKFWMLWLLKGHSLYATLKYDNISSLLGTNAIGYFMHLTSTTHIVLYILLDSNPSTILD